MKYLCTIANTEENHKFIEQLRAHVKTEGDIIRLRGRGNRHGSKRFRQELPLSLSTSFAVYIGKPYPRRP